ncbi:MAG TPA: metal ABC transporter ATP-binding protein [Actinomycetota bacterium]|nr:metal ABC transporter ATP-binding protein [Actinomycetota bacterium]
MTPALALSGGRVLLGGAPVLTGVDFRLARGELVVLLGPNGAGKTTLVRALLGLAPLAAGRAELLGQPLERFRAWHLIGYVPQRGGATTGVPATVEEVVLTGRSGRRRWSPGYRTEDRAAAGRALAAVGLEPLGRARVGQLSGGQGQRVLIARALAAEPEVLVLDEPVSGVDPEGRARLLDALAGLRARGCAILLVAHAVGDVAPLTDRTVVLRDGRVVHDGAPGTARLEEPEEHHHPERAPGPTFGRIGEPT